MHWLSYIYELFGRLGNTLLGLPFVPRMRRSVRVRAFVLNKNEEIILVRSWLGYQQWSLPGGGIKRGEPPELAASREVFEESGVHVPGNAFHVLGLFTNNDSRVPFTVHCLVAVVDKQPIHVVPGRRHEILGAAWFPLTQLPTRRSANVDEALTRYRASKQA